MNEIKTFQNPEFGAIRTIRDAEGEPLFCAKDVCDALGYINGRDAVRKHVDGEDKTTVALCDTGANYKTNAVFITESGLYALILGSKLEGARRFKHWVTSEVLPSIRWAGRVYGAIRTIRDDKGEPLFCAKDVCEALGYSNSREALRKHVEKDDVTKRDTLDALGREGIWCHTHHTG